MIDNEEVFVNNWEEINEEVFVNNWTAELFANFSGVNTEETKENLLDIAEEFVEVVDRYFEGMSLDNTAEEIAEHYLLTAN